MCCELRYVRFSELVFDMVSVVKRSKRRLKERTRLFLAQQKTAHEIERLVMEQKALLEELRRFMSISEEGVPPQDPSHGIGQREDPGQRSGSPG